MKIAITGAGGHVGNALCRELTNQGARLRILLLENEEKPTDVDAEVIVGNILDKDALATLIKDVEVVYHLAAIISIDKKDSQRIFETNVTGTKNVIEICKTQNVKKFIHFGTIHSLKVIDPDIILDESNPMAIDSKIAYEASKAEAETLVLEAAQTGLDACIINPTAIVGPYDFQPSYLGQALIKIYQNKLPMLVSGGYDFVDVRDVASAAISAAKKGRRGERYIVSGKWLSLKDLSVKIGKLTGHKTPKFVAPTLLAKAGLPFIHAWAKLFGQHPLYTAESLDILRNSSRNVSCRKARKELGYKPRSLEETIVDTFDWFEENKLV